MHAKAIGSSIHGGAIFVLLLILTLYSVGKLYCLEWRKLVKDGFAPVLSIYEGVVLPSATIMILLGQAPVHEIWNMPGSALLLGVLFVLFGDWFGLTRNVIASAYPGINELESRKLFLHFPPTSRFDLLPLDVMFNATLFFILYKRFF